MGRDAVLWRRSFSGVSLRTDTTRQAQEDKHKKTHIVYVPWACSPASTTKQQRVRASFSSHDQPLGLRECERRSTCGVLSHCALSHCAPQSSHRPGTRPSGTWGSSRGQSVVLRAGERNARKGRERRNSLIIT
eukprot:scaffold64618_cov54-Phaeocystis_antarctica.AAC.5